MLAFSKYHGLGNDFLVVDLRSSPLAASVQTPRTARALCDRRFGVGGDGVLALLPPTADGADVRMRVLNADGSEAEMCGNGIRCVARYLHERDAVLGGRALLRIETLAGVLPCVLSGDSVSVEMGRPRLRRGELPMTGPPDETFIDAELPGALPRATAVSMGNPHVVLFVPEEGAALRALAERVGPGLEVHHAFPARTNVELARVDDDGIELVVWERGCGVTLACGTGACATAVAACLTGRATRGQELRVRLLGGDLHITVAPDDAGVSMRGPATFVFDGTADLGAVVSRGRARD
jgi:diaminopimelate epimerase